MGHTDFTKLPAICVATSFQVPVIVMIFKSELLTIMTVRLRPGCSEKKVYEK